MATECVYVFSGSFSEVNSAIDWAAAIGAATGAVSAGSSMAYTMSSFDHNVACEIQIENWTKYQLTDVYVGRHGGRFYIPPTTIVRAGEKEKFVSINMYVLTFFCL